MRILYGSQNFGYDVDNSDIDYVDILVPSLDDLIQRRKLYGQVKTDTGIIKQYDIRCFNNIANGESFSDGQILFSKQYYDCHKLDKLLEMRGEILVANQWRMFKANYSVINRSLVENTAKSLTRAYTFLELLKRVLLFGSNVQSLYNSKTKGFRLKAISMYENNSIEEIEEIKKALRSELSELENQYVAYEGKVDHRTIEEVGRVVRSIIKEGIVSES